MTGLLVDTVKRLTEAWVSRLALPGLLYVASLGVAAVLGWRHAFDVRLLAERLQGWIGDAPAGSAPSLLLTAALGLLAAAGVGLAAEGLGSVVARLWACEGWTIQHRPVGAVLRWWADRRADRWEDAITRYRGKVRDIAGEVARAEAGVARERPYDLADTYLPVLRLGRTRPARPTWVGDRLRELSAGLYNRYGLDVTYVWPALSLTMPAQATDAVGLARDGYRRASVLAAWSLMYIPLGVVWPPAFLVVAFTAATAAQRGRAAIERYCLLVEASVVLYAPSLAQGLHIEAPNGLDRSVGAAITSRLGGEADVP